MTKVRILADEAIFFSVRLPDWLRNPTTVLATGCWESFIAKIKRQDLASEQKVPIPRQSVCRTLRSLLLNTTSRFVGRRNFVCLASAEFYVFCDVTLAGLVSRGFEGTYCLFLKVWEIHQQHNVTSHTNWMYLLLLFTYVIYISRQCWIKRKNVGNFRLNSSGRRSKIGTIGWCGVLKQILFCIWFGYTKGGRTFWMWGS